MKLILLQTPLDGSHAIMITIEQWQSLMPPELIVTSARKEYDRTTIDFTYNGLAMYFEWENDLLAIQYPTRRLYCQFPVTDTNYFKYATDCLFDLDKRWYWRDEPYHNRCRVVTSAEHRRNLSISRRSRVTKPGLKRNSSDSIRLGSAISTVKRKPLSDEARANISRGHTGIKFTPERCLAISRAKKGKGRPWSAKRRAAHDAKYRSQVA